MWIFLDFDGTITEQDACDTILAQYCNTDWEKIGSMWSNNLIDSAEMHNQFCQNMHATTQEIHLSLKKLVRLRSGVHFFLNQALQHKHKVCIISSGWDIYIKPFFEGINHYLATDISQLQNYSLLSNHKEILIVANHVTEQVGKLTFHNNFPGDWSCQTSSPCKAKVISTLCRNENDIKIALGDGKSDICMVEVVDTIYATATLKKSLETIGLKHSTFISFDKLTEDLFGIRH